MKKRLSAAAAAFAIAALPAAAFAEATPEYLPEPNPYADTAFIGGADGPTAVYTTGTAMSPYNSSAPDITDILDPEAITANGVEGAANIYYNSAYLDPAIMINGRTMVPFRDFLEKIGAEVNYSEADRRVTASRYETEISFSLDGGAIHIKNDMGETDIYPDIAPVVINDTIYAPVRFLSEAFAMQVGWSGYQRTALIADYDKYCAELWEKCPNITKLAELGLQSPARALSESNLAMNFSAGAPPIVIGEQGSDSFSFETSLKSSASTVGTDQLMNIKGSFKASGTDMQAFELKDTELDIITKDNVFYIKTNVMKQLTEAYPDMGIPESFTDPETWYKISFEDYMTIMTGGVSIDLDAYNNMLENANDPRAIMEYMIKSTGALHSTYSVDSITEFIAAIAEIDKSISVKNNGDDFYIVTMAMDKDFLYNTAAAMSGDDSMDVEEIKNEFENEFDKFEFEISLNETIENKICTSQQMSMIFSFIEDGFGFDLSLSADGTVDPNADVEDIKVPENYVDILKSFYGLDSV